MKILFFMAFFMLIASTTHCFELYGSWKTDALYEYEYASPLFIIKFDKEKYYYGKHSLDAKYKQTGNEIYVECLPVTLKIVVEDDEIIKVSFEDPSLPKDIVYTRISDEEAAKLLQQNR